MAASLLKDGRVKLTGCYSEKTGKTYDATVVMEDTGEKTNFKLVLQYVMGHSDVGVTLNVYTHASYDRAAEQMAKIIDFKGTVTPEKQRKSG